MERRPRRWVGRAAAPALAASLLAAPAAEAAPTPTHAPAPANRTCPGTVVRLGAEAPEVRVDAYLDPAHGAAPELVDALALLVARSPMRLAVDLHFGTSPPRRRNRRPLLARVRALAVALARAGRFADFLDRVRGADLALLGARLAAPRSRRRILRDLGLDPADHRAALEDPCVARALADHGRYVQRGSIVTVVDGELTSDGTDLRSLRVLLANLRTAQAAALRTSPTPAPAAGKRIAALAHPDPAAGLLLGGPGLPHHAVLFARDEADPILRSALPILLAERRARPGRLSVQIVAVGDLPLARDLAVRLCAARKLGLALDYARYLARPRKEREVLLGPEAALLRRLDAAEAACETATAQPHDGPEGPWLDGRLVATAQLPSALATLEATAPSPWEPLLAAAAPPLP